MILPPRAATSCILETVFSKSSSAGATTITGTYGAGQTAFTLVINANGTITYTQFVPFNHPTDGSSADALNDLLPNTVLKVDFFDSNPVGIELPQTVVLEVSETEPGMKGATASSSYKPAKMETGLTIQIPPFVEAGSKIEIDTRETCRNERDVGLDRASRGQRGSRGGAQRFGGGVHRDVKVVRGA